MEVGGAVPAKTPDKSKRDEWSEGGIMSLLDVYESKWLLRNRAKLKGSDWDNIAHQVSARDSGTKPLKTPNQCKNKIESMKKRYRTESSVNHNPGLGSSWQFYARMDGLLKGGLQSKVGVGVGDGVANGVTQVGSSPAFPNLMEDSQKRVIDNGGPTQARVVENEKARNCEGQEHAQDSNQDDSKFSTPSPRNRDRDRVANINMGDGSRKIKRRKSCGGDVAESIRMLAHSVLKIEQTRMEMYKDSERLRVEAEIKRAEMDLKRTEIIAKTQLQIAKLFAKKRTCNHHNNTGNSSLVAEPIVATNADDKNG
uniref:Myb/SANT-like DNA-binding domain-containing protein n=1 Tax=Davidia involucrata TaxID=16924 RepID=A0A5B7BRU4_DAVIN